MQVTGFHAPLKFPKTSFAHLEIDSPSPDIPIVVCATSATIEANRPQYNHKCEHLAFQHAPCEADLRIVAKSPSKKSASPTSSCQEVDDRNLRQSNGQSLVLLVELRHLMTQGPKKIATRCLRDNLPCKTYNFSTGSSRRLASSAKCSVRSVRTRIFRPSLYS